MVQHREAFMQIDPNLFRAVTFKQCGGISKVLGVNTEIQIAVMTQTGVRIRAGDGPTLNQDGIQLFLVKQAKDLSNIVLMNCRFKCQLFVGPKELLRRLRPTSLT